MTDKALDQFVRRVAYGKKIKKLDGQGLHSGSPFYYYCKHCGIPTETFPEEPLMQAKQICTQCEFLEENNLLEKAKKISEKFFERK